MGAQGDLVLALRLAKMPLVLMVFCRRKTGGRLPFHVLPAPTLTVEAQTYRTTQRRVSPSNYTLAIGGWFA